MTSTERERKIEALRVVCDEYSDEHYVLGEMDCCTLVADYLYILGVEHNWDGDSQAAMKNPLRTLVAHLGERHDVEGLKLGDVVYMNSKETGSILGLLTGRGIICMTQDDGLVVLDSKVPVKGVWRF